MTKSDDDQKEIPSNNKMEKGIPILNEKGQPTNKIQRGDEIIIFCRLNRVVSESPTEADGISVNSLESLRKK